MNGLTQLIYWLVHDKLHWTQAASPDAMPWFWLVLAAVAAVVPVWLLAQAVAGVSTYIERKVAADIQRRVGPNQAGILGKSLKKDVIPLLPLPDSLNRLIAALIPGFIDRMIQRIGGIGEIIFLADGVKLIMKEDLVPAKADKPLFRLSPMLVVMSIFPAWAVLPFAARYTIANLNIGIFFIAAVTSIAVIGILMAGWASNNKWALLGGMRAAAQIVSYELPAGMVIITAILITGSMSMFAICENQCGYAVDHARVTEQIAAENAHLVHPAQGTPPGPLPVVIQESTYSVASVPMSGWFFDWNIFNPVLLVLAGVYFVSILAESNRTPFDIPEAESELVAGYHTEYSGIRFSFFMMAEFNEVWILAGVFVTIFLGGFYSGIPWLEHLVMIDPHAAKAFHFDNYAWYSLFLHVPAFLLKTFAVVLVIMWVRWTLPRFRVDQMMSLCWKKLIPIAASITLVMTLWTLFSPGIYAALSTPAIPGEFYGDILKAIFSIALAIWLFRFFRQPTHAEATQRNADLVPPTQVGTAVTG
ncbi:MAG: complex I subunit 1/NuoH family protein [Planctomycetota bacterium]